MIAVLTTFFSTQIIVLAATDYDAAEVAKIMKETDVFNLKSKSSILMDAFTGNIILEQNSRERRPMASITKIMSMILVMEAIEKGELALDDMVPVSEYAYGFGGSQVYLKPGEEFTVHEMLKAVAIHSANDATVALAEKIAGSEEVFVSMMNEKAKELGMNDTHFEDCSGLETENHYSTAYDIAIMSRTVVNKYPKILEYTKIWHDTFRNGEFSLDNTNKLVRHYQGTIGLKTGYISAAGYCLSAVVKRDNLTLISVVLGAPDSNTRFAESRKLLDYGFANYETFTLDEKYTEVGVIEVRKGLKTSVRALIAEDVNVLLKKGTKQEIERHSSMEPFLVAPVQAGQKVGVIIYKLGEQEIARVDVVAEEGIEKASFIKLFIRMIKEWFGIGKSKDS
ncbi:MAG: D-alanyl-D-alanine carboxypeptidase [Clostridiaceae bacterium]|nr:D-alanyl-D-alanine carboxypeptidase [Clostridiaceae bacterium]